MNCHIPKINNQLSQVSCNKANHLGQLDVDQVIVEEPLQISLNWQDNSEVFTITMRTPGDDVALACGLLFCEGQINSIDDIENVEFEGNDRATDTMNNHLMVNYSNNKAPDLSDLQRKLISQSSCGVCGKTSVKSLELKANKAIDKTTHWLIQQQIMQLPNILKNHQPLFQLTGGVHACGLFNDEYQLLDTFEDVGRHNALDKLIGHQLLQGKPTPGRCILVLSGRVSFELVQKAVCAGYPVIVAVGAPSSLALSAAKRFDITLIGFTKPDSFNVYHGQWRIKN